MKKGMHMKKLITLCISIIFIGILFVPTFQAEFPEHLNVSHQNFPVRYKEQGTSQDQPTKNPKVLDVRDHSWTPIEVVSSESASFAFFPEMVVGPDDTIHVMWIDATDYEGSGTDSDVFYKNKIKGGSWSSTEVVSIDSDQFAYIGDIDVDFEGTIHIVWCENNSFGGSGDDPDIFYSFKPVDGYWAHMEVVSIESDSISLEPSIAVDLEGNVHVTWYDEVKIGDEIVGSDIYYKMKPVGGSWTDTSTELVSTESSDFSYSSVIDVDPSGTVHIAWSDCSDIMGAGTDNDIFYKKRVDGGGWTQTEIVSTESSNQSCWLSLVVGADETVHISWDEYARSSEDYVVYKSKSTEGQWSSVELVSTESNDWAFSPQLDLDHENTVHVAWCDYSDYNGAGWDSEIFYKKKQNQVWTTTEVVSTGEVESRDPALVVDSLGAAHITWNEQINFEQEDLEIYYRSQNLPPQQPSTPLGPEYGEINKPYNFSTSSTDPDGDKISYGWDWNGDLDVDLWTNLYNSGEICEISQSYSYAGTFEVRAIAKDSMGGMSPWSDPLVFEIVSAKLNITEISGGLGISATINNTGELNATNLEWHIYVEGGFMGLIDIDKNSSEEVLHPQKNLPITSGFLGVFHLGPIKIEVTVEADNTDKVSETISGFMIGPLVLLTK